MQDNRLKQIGIIGKGSQGGRVYSPEGVSCQLTALRRLTPMECERLQGFKDGWTEGISDTQRYKCLGNAVTVPIVKLIGEKLLSEIQKELIL